LTRRSAAAKVAPSSFPRKVLMTTRWLLFVSALALLLSLSAGTATAAPPVVIGDPKGTQYADSWGDVDSGQGKKGTGEVGALWTGGVCRGSFSNAIRNTSSVQFGAYWQCTSSTVFTEIKAGVQLCDRVGTYYGCNKETTRWDSITRRATGYYNRSDASFPCTVGVTRYYRPVAVQMSVNYQPVYDKFGTIVSVPCGT
jgi:hypothetical protein